MKNPFLIGQKIYLRAPEDGDEQIIVLSENHPSPRETLFYAIPRSTASMKDRIRTMEDDPNSIVFSICNIKSNKVIGITALLRIDWVGRAAIFYIAISQKENWSQGYGSETTRLMIDYAFETFNLNRIQLHVGFIGHFFQRRTASDQVDNLVRYICDTETRILDSELAAQFVVNLFKRDR